MAWYQTGVKTLFERITTKFYDSTWRYKAPESWYVVWVNIPANIKNLVYSDAVNPSCCLRVVWQRSLFDFAWWRHQMETFSVLLALCVGNSPVTSEFPSQRPVTRSFDVFFDLRLNKRLRKQSIRRWCGRPSGSLWRHCDEIMIGSWYREQCPRNK